MGDVEYYNRRLRSGRDTMDLPSTDNIGSEEIWQLAVARTEAQTYQEELVSVQETVTVLQSQLQTAKLEAKVDKLRAM